MDAFDADVLIYAAVPGHPLGRRVRALFAPALPSPFDRPAGLGSVLLLPEVLGKPMREGATEDVQALAGLLSRLELRPVDRIVAEVAVALSGRYRIRAADIDRYLTERAVRVGEDI